MKDITVLGSTGSIGTQTLEVAERLGVKVSALTADRSTDLVEKQARRFKVKAVALNNEAAAKDLKVRLSDTDIKVFSGSDGVCEVAASYGDTAVCSIVGIAGLKPTISAIKAKKTIALANKETLVTGGNIVKKLIKEYGVKLLPVDSEHSAIFQSLQGTPKGSLKRILLTASGGPFFGMKREELLSVPPSRALKHPNWSMGAKITIDSATLMNKGLEVIEAVHLFDVKPSDIEVLVHRQSILHSAVELTDGAVIAQLGTPDMRLPIQYALTYPERAEAFDRLDLFKIKNLTFEKPDTETFRLLPLCINAIEKGGLYPTAVNGANEEAVAAYLSGKIGFLDIADFVENAMDKCINKPDFTVEDIFDADKLARQTVISLIERK